MNNDKKLTTTYEDALRSVSDVMDLPDSKFNIFDASLLLAKMFRVDKETFADMIMEYRKQNLRKNNDEKRK